MLRRQVVSCLASCSNSSGAWLYPSFGFIDKDDGKLAHGFGTASQRCPEAAMEPSMALGRKLEKEQGRLRLPWLQGLARCQNSAMGSDVFHSLAPLRRGLGHAIGAISWPHGSAGPMAGACLPSVLLPGASERCITTKTWRRLKIKKHKIRKRRRLNRKAAK
ncbi:hypothetical protein Vretimale_10242 [Volvox reticuliferus]|uniref:Uncharacterized protein n=1 Tax=Volvox reticuliferus TaxID=1737510 RepID=A0A8J4LQH5_9CHLO|nr:hypothetical protein Vretifemale_712 [Volvox reticuliferus]GIM05775.1 hypothetical protein Vretimale_10242 [Volvox reticuliferus]